MLRGLEQELELRELGQDLEGLLQGLEQELELRELGQDLEGLLQGLEQELEQELEGLLRQLGFRVVKGVLMQL